MFSSIAGRLSISNVKFQSLNKKSYVEALTLKTLCLVETDAEYFIQYQYKWGGEQGLWDCGRRYQGGNQSIDGHHQDICLQWSC